MALTKDEIEQLVSSPSLGAVVYQANTLIDQLNRITDEEFLPEACIIREILLCYAEKCRDELIKLYDPTKKYTPKGGLSGTHRVRALGNAVRELYSFIRYLLASSPRQAPPALQVALGQLRELYFPKDVGTSICVVRPQWKYNLEYVPLSSKLTKVVAPSVLDPEGGLTHSEDIIPPWWVKRRKKRSDVHFVGKNPPQQLAILSFAGLDTNDSLCFPLLAHELGHFIAFLDRYADALRKETSEVSKVRIDEVESVLTRFAPSSTFDVIITKRNKLANQVSVCQRELLADLLATRMMGLSFFMAQAEYLKTLAPWFQPRILTTGYPEGYPGIRFRLWSILRHLFKVQPNSPDYFLESQDKTNRDAATLLEYLNEWKQNLKIEDSDPPLGKENEVQKLETELAKIVEKKVLASLDGITRVAQLIVPDEQCAKLSAAFFERIIKLTRKLPPSCTHENAHSFSEMMSAAWAYQVLYGEEQEANKRHNHEKYSEYNKTCDLILKAIELIPAAQAIRPTRVLSKRFKSADSLSARGVLSREHIINRIHLPVTHPSHLAILPINFKAVNGASLDVHLGNWFSYARRTKLNSVAINDTRQKHLLSTIGREESFVPIGGHFLLHPGDLVLGATQEFVGLPNDIMAFVEGKSGLGRLGLFVATATQVAPGFHGVIVLELANAGTVPLDLSPGMAIAQLVFQTMTGRTDHYDGQSSGQIKP